MPFTFHAPKNNAATTVSAPRSAGAASLVVADATQLPSSFPYILTAVRSGAPLCILNVTAASGNTLTVSGAIEGTADAALVAGDGLELRWTALAMTEVQAAVNSTAASLAGLTFPAVGGTVAPTQLPASGVAPGTYGPVTVDATGRVTAANAAAGGGDLSYVFTQSAPSATWTITHNLGKYPSVSVVDGAGSWFIGAVNYVSVNQVVVTFSAAFSGLAYLN